MKIVTFAAACLAVFSPLAPVVPVSAPALGGDSGGPEYKVLAPISHGNLTIFPVVATRTHDTSAFLTLDEGIRSGEVTVTEVGKITPMMRRPNARPVPRGPQVNQLVLVNNSARPLILLAGEVVTGGQQDRIVAKDRIVPPESDPVDLSVFCVEHGRWTETASKFDTHANFMAQPSVRKRALADNSQQKVWDEVGRSNSAIMANAYNAAPRPGPESGNSADRVLGLQGVTSYAKVRENKEIQRQVDSVVEPIQKSFDSVIRQLRDQNAVGVVVAIKGRIIWADIFASNALLSKYWAKLLPSYAAEALSMSAGQSEVTVSTAQNWVGNWQARHEVVETEPGLYRQTELTGDNFRAFELASLLPRHNFDLHLSKMSE
jgi:hypothetical protein